MSCRAILPLAVTAALAAPAAVLAQDDPCGGDRPGTCSVVQSPEPEQQPTAPKAQQPKAFALAKGRVWRLRGAARGYDTGGRTLHVRAVSVGGLAPRLAARLRAALGDDVDVLVGPRTRVLDAAGRRVSGEGVPEALDEATSVTVTGRLAAPRVWRTAADGTPVPALRALRVKLSRG